MPSLPQKSVKGAFFKKWVVESIDKLIDYLSSTYIQVGQGLKINRTPSGLVIELAKPAKETQSNTTGGGSQTVSGMTYPDWAIGMDSGIYPNSQITTLYDGWIFVDGWWDSTASGAGTSFAYLEFETSGGGTTTYTIGRFRSTTEGQYGFFSAFLPVKVGSKITLSISTSGKHEFNFNSADSGFYRAQS